MAKNWITSEQLSKTLKLPFKAKSWPFSTQVRDSHCHLALVPPPGVGQGIIAYFGNISKLVLLTNHHLIPSKASVNKWKLSVGTIKGKYLCEENFSTCISCCGADGILGAKEHGPEQKVNCPFNADFTALIVSEEFTKELVASNLRFPVVDLSDMKLLNAANYEELCLMRYEGDTPSPIRLNNLTERTMISSTLPLSKRVNVYKQLCQLKYQAAGVGGGDSGAGIFLRYDSTSSENNAVLVGLHKATQTRDDHALERTDHHFGIAIHFILHVTASKYIIHANIIIILPYSLAKEGPCMNVRPPPNFASNFF